MPARLYLRAQPRAFFLLTDTRALVFRQPGAGDEGGGKASRSVVVAEFLPVDEVDTFGLVEVNGGGRNVQGVLGVTSVPSDRSPIPDVFLVILTSSTPLLPLLPGSPLRPARVVSVDFYSLTSSYWDPPGLVPDLASEEDFDSQYRVSGKNLSQAAVEGVENPTSGMKKYLENGGFFHAEGCSWDISKKLGSPGNNFVGAATEPHQLPRSDNGGGTGQNAALEDFDERFVWNATLLAPFLAFRAGLTPSMRDELDAHAVLLPIIQGFVGSVPLATGKWTDGAPDPGALALISRLSCKRAGARFRTRGIDDDGNVANFVETETVLTIGAVCLSYAQVRGSVPVFWQQPQQGLGTLQQKVEITRPAQATQAAFDKHFMILLERYDAVHAINLLGQKDAEAMLSMAYADHFANLRSSLSAAPVAEGLPSPNALVYTPYDFHAVVRVGGHDAVRSELSVMHALNTSVEKFSITAIDATTGEVVEWQHGVFRTNCLDCLDRTNYVQEVLSTIALRRFLAAHGSVLLNSPTLWSAHRELWADNGDRLSKTYAGTGALNTSATRTGRKTFAGLLSDATKSVGRAYINNFQDKNKQMAIDMLLGLMAGQRPVVLFDPVGDSIHSALAARKAEYAVPRDLVIFSGTWNVNGKAANEPLDPWLFPHDAPKKADIYAIAFQEIVELTPQQIVVTDPAKKRAWEGYIMDTFAQNSSDGEYILMRSEQLVGTALMVVVRASLLPAIRNIEYADKKTGLQGMTGNKGGVGVRFNCYDSSICLMTCHLAAGQGNYADRNADYRTINNGLKFLRGKTIDSHDIVVWAADFNYRIDLSNEEAREYAESDQLDHLVAADQLTFARDEGEVFIGYSEGALTFRPTYKYDNGTDVYDSSEKQRIPSWTVLYKGNGLKLRAYSCANLRTSDHRPVYAVMEATVVQVDEARKARIAEELTVLARRKLGSGKLDDRVEQAAQGGVKSLVKEFTAVSLDPTPSPSPKPVAPPPISRDSKPKSKTAGAGTSSSSTTDATLNAINSAYARLGVPPPLPARNGSPTTVAAPATSTSTSTPQSPQQATPYETRRKPPPRPTEFGKIGLPQETNSPEITPVATGDFVLVPSPKRAPAPPLPLRQGYVTSTHSAPPALPVRPRPTPPPSTATVAPAAAVAAAAARPVPALPTRKQSTLDMDAAPPEGLWAPALPDNVRRAAPAPPRIPDRPERSALAPSPPPALAGKVPPPAVKPKPAAVADKAVTPAATKVPPPKPAPIAVPEPAGAAEGTGAGSASSMLTSPTATSPRAKARPIVPAKPVALKKPTGDSPVDAAGVAATSPEKEQHAPAPQLAPKPSGLKGKTLTM